MRSANFDRKCHFQLLEPRQLLAADVFPKAIADNPLDSSSEAVAADPDLFLAGNIKGGVISGRVYLSDNQSSSSATNPLGVAEVTIRLLSETGQIVEETQTDGDGHYRFSGLSPGIYAVHEAQPGEYVDGGAHIGSNGGVLFESNLIGEIVVGIHSALTDYNFYEYPSGSALETEVDGLPPVVAHFSSDALVNQRIPKGALLHLLYGTQKSGNLNSALEDSPQQYYFATTTHVSHSPSVTPQVTIIGGSSSDRVFSWQLSVLDVGRSGDSSIAREHIQLINTLFDTSLVQQSPRNQDAWISAHSDFRPKHDQYDAVFGHPDALAIAGDWNGDGRDDFGLFLDGQWFLDLNGNRQWDEDDFWAHLGTAGDLPVVGDWNGDGKTDIGVFGPTRSNGRQSSPRGSTLAGVPHQQAPLANRLTSTDSKAPAIRPQYQTNRTSQGKLRAEAVDRVFHCGGTGDYPIAGDWNGDGVDTIGLYRDGLWKLDVDGDSKFTDVDIAVRYGDKEDLPVVGDWNGSGKDQIGVFRSGTWMLDRNGNGILDTEDYAHAFELGAAGDQPVVGDWDGNGTDEAGVYQPDAAQPRVARQAS